LVGAGRAKVALAGFIVAGWMLDGLGSRGTLGL
jgi:hypothetical protein